MEIKEHFYLIGMRTLLDIGTKACFVNFRCLPNDDDDESDVSVEKCPLKYVVTNAQPIPHSKHFDSKEEAESFLRTILFNDTETYRIVPVDAAYNVNAEIDFALPQTGNKNA